MSNTQILHDRVNLIRLVSRLEEDVANRQDWGSSGLSAWVKATNAAQSLGYARQLLRNLQDYELDTSYASTSTGTLPDLQRILDQLEPIVNDVQKQLAPKPRVPRKSLLSELPQPLPRLSPKASTLPPIDAISAEPAALVDAPEASATSRAANEILLALHTDVDPSSHPHTDPSPTLAEKLPGSLPAEKSKAGDSGTSDATSRFLSTSLQTQEELSAQLAQMATRLKMNSLHFTEALARDRAVMEGAEEKLEGNLSRMKTERTRLKVHSGKSGSTTWIVMLAILTVAIAWIVMFFIIRVT